jgi:RimJ/RimL family protein N-acetyltransferase
MILTTTERLTISKVTLADAPFFLELVNTPNFKKYIGDKNLSSIAGVEDYLKAGILKSYEDHGFSYYTLRLHDSEEILGIVGILKRDNLECPDIGFAMLPQFEGKGYGYESSVAMMQLAKAQFGIDKIAAITLEHNTNSINLITKLGLEFEKKVKPFADEAELLFFAKLL